VRVWPSFEAEQGKNYDIVRVPSAIFNAVQPQKWAKPEGLIRKMAIHCVMLLDNNPLLPSSHAFCLAVFRLSAGEKQTSTDPRVKLVLCHFSAAVLDRLKCSHKNYG